MVPSKSTRKSSRRSSILKPPKPRQPLQNLNFENSLNESSSSTTKIKRRVSFAEKKHVKEFCNSLEQGTVWYNTYEEHDISNLKISTSDQEESQLENISKGSAHSNTQENSVQFTCSEEIKRNLNIEDFSQSVNLNKDENCQDAVLPCTPVSVSFDAVPQKDHIVQNVQQFDKSNTMITVNNLSKSMELTVTIPSIIEADDNVETLVCSVDDRTKKFDDVFVELTAAVSTTLYNLRSNSSKINHNLNLDRNDNTIKSIIFHDDPMNITEHVDKSASKNNDEEISVNSNESIYNDETMELTAAITPSFEIYQNNSEKPIENTANLQINLEGTRIFNDEGMEFTTAIKASPEVPQNNSQMLVKNTPYLQTNLDQTRICNDEEMEFTTVVTTAESIVHKNDSQIPIEKIPSLQPSFDRTKICNDEEMEFTTAAIATATKVHQNDSQIPIEKISSLQSNFDRTKICNDEEMEFTAVTPTQIPIKKIPSLESSLNRTKICNDEAMEFTTAITTATKVHQDDSQMPIENSLNLQSNFDKTRICNDEEMEFTAVAATQIPTENISSLQPNFDRTRICNDEEMEFTAVAATQIPTEKISSLQPNFDRTKICNDEEMEFTSAAITTATKVYQNDSQMPIENTPNLQSNFNRTRICNDEEMEFTSAALTTATKVHQNDSQIPIENTPNLQSNFDGTKICNDEAMEFTTAVTLSSEVQQNDSQISVKNIPCLQRNLSSSMLNIFKSDCTNSTSNGTTIFYNNSMTMTKVVSFNADVTNRTSDKTNQESSKTMLFPNTSMEVTNAVATTQLHFQADNTTVNSINVVANSSILADKIPNDSMSLLLNSDKMPGKENEGISSTKGTENSLVEKSIPIEVQNFANIKLSTALHVSMQQHACVSALKENNIDKACGVLNPENGSFSAVNLEIDKTDKNVQNATSGSRRTYVVQPLNNDQTHTLDNKENKISETSCETSFYNSNDKENNACNITNVQTGGDCDGERLMEEYITFPNEDLEEIDLIEPPEFVCLDDVSTTFSNDSCHQEIDTEKNCLSAKENIDPEICSKSKINYSDQNAQQYDEENVRKSRTFVVKCSRPYEKLETSTLEQEEQGQINKIPKLQLVDMKDTDANIQVLGCSSIAISDNEKIVASNAEKDLEDLHRKSNYYIENLSMECLSSNMVPIYESTPKVDNKNNDKLLSVDTMEIDNPSYCNEQIKESDVACTEENTPIELDPFSSLMNELKACAKSDDIIWEVYHENIERNVFVIGFISCSLLVIIYVRDLSDVTNDRYIKEVKVTSRLAEHAGELLGIIHRVILEKLDGEKLLDLYGTREDVLPMLDHIAKEVKLAMDFLFEVKRLRDVNLMEIARESISFVSRSKRMDTILKITICIKPFERIEPQDISVHCTLGSVREEDIKMMITNIKRDHRFLRTYIKDVKDYINLMEECGGMIGKAD